MTILCVVTYKLDDDERVELRRDISRSSLFCDNCSHKTQKANPCISTLVVIMKGNELKALATRRTVIDKAYRGEKTANFHY